MKDKLKYIIIALLTIGFLVLLYCVLSGYTENFDAYIYELVTFNKSGIVTNFYKVVTFFGSTKFIVSLCLFFLIIFFKKQKGSIISICLIISTFLNNVLKLIIRRERPLELMLVKESSFSFPSGHTMAAVSMYGLLIYFVYKSNWNKSVKFTLITLLNLIILGIAISRIYLGAHYASDVLGGIILSSIWLLIFTGIINKYEDK